jgi:hypothetical protein
VSRARRSLTATLVALLLLGTGVFAVWLMAASGIFAASAPAITGPLPVASAPGVVGPVGGTPLPAAGYQVAQPRDPFQPLQPPPPTTTAPGVTTTTQPGTPTTGPGETTTTTADFQPGGTRVALLEIREESGLRRAVLTVDGVTYTVGVGDTFADSFKVLSLSDSSGVFQYGDTAFSLAVGQAILK